VTDAVGAEVRDSLWDQPDLMPDADDIDDPARVIARLQGAGELDEMDLALQELLDDAERGGQGDAADAPTDRADRGEPGDGDEAGTQDTGDERGDQDAPDGHDQPSGQPRPGDPEVDGDEPKQG
jgi:hypothetical protein